MGTDIHCFVEKRNKKGVWEQITGFETSWGTDAVSPLEDRNYDMFAVLADVRNGVGFAGVPTGEPVEPISEPRGLPYDISDEVFKELDHEGWLHNVSWLTVQDLLDYDIDQVKKQEGFVSAEGYRLHKEGKPFSSCGYTSAPKCDIEELEEMDRKYPEKRYCAKLHWEEPLKEACSPLFDTALEQLIERCDEEDHSDVRIVFGFDN